MNLQSQSKQVNSKMRDNDNNVNGDIENHTNKQNQSSIVCAGYFTYSTIMHFGNEKTINYFGESFTMCIGSDGNVYSFGYSKKRVHGHEKLRMRIPMQINNLKNIKMIDCTINNSIFLNYDGCVFILGDNYGSTLKIHESRKKLKCSHIPRKINAPPCKQVCCSWRFSFLLSEDNVLYSLCKDYINYQNIESQINITDINLSTYDDTPQLITMKHNVEYVVCGGYHSICKTYDNKFYYCVYNKNDYLTGIDIYKSYKFTRCLNWPDNIISIKCGNYHRLLLTSKGYVYSLGSNRRGQLGINNKIMRSVCVPILISDIPKIKRIECGDLHSMLIDENDYLWVFGDNTHKQLGLGDIKRIYNPILHPILPNIMDISSRGIHTFVKTFDNKIYGLGNNNYSQLKIKTSQEYHPILFQSQKVPIQTLIDDEDIWCSTIGKSKQKIS